MKASELEGDQQRMDSLEDMLMKGVAQQHSGRAAMSASEAERLIESLQYLTIEEVGTQKWQTQYESISQLNIQAHYNARTNSDEFVVDLLVSLDKVGVLVHDLLVIEAWKEKVMVPHLMKHIADKVDSVTSYMLLFHECSVANLIEITLFHSKVCESIPEEYLLELADWVYRKLAYLNSNEAYKFAEDSKKETMSAKQMMDMSPLDEMKERSRELEFAAAMQCLSIVRYLSDQLSSAPMGLVSRLVSTNDSLMALIPLIDKPPWIRRRVIGGKGAPKTERWEAAGSSHWTAVEASDRLKLGQHEIQIWLTVNNLLVDPKSRTKYVGSIDEYRKERVLGLRRHLNELMFDQLPVLKDLQRMLDELSLGGGGVGDKEASKHAGLILEAVPVVRDGMIRGRDWKKEAERQVQSQFKEGGSGMDQKRAEMLSKLFDQLCELEGEAEGIKAGQAPTNGSIDPSSTSGARNPSLPGPIKVECRRKVHESGVWEPWCEFELNVDPSKHPDPVEVSGSSSSSGEDGGATVHGLRYKLLPINPDEACPEPLPSNGKIIVKVPVPSPPESGSGSGLGSEGSSHHLVVSQAQLQLPDVPLKDQASELPPIVWVTVGLLAVDGIALQVKLKRDDKPKQRDKFSGVWYCYRPVGGALTVLRGAKKQPSASEPPTKPPPSAPQAKPPAALEHVSQAKPPATVKHDSQAKIYSEGIVGEKATSVHQEEDDLNLPD